MDGALNKKHSFNRLLWATRHLLDILEERIVWGDPKDVWKGAARAPKGGGISEYQKTGNPVWVDP